MTTTRRKMKNEVIYTDRGVVPLPTGWTKDQVIAVLEEVGHKILSVSEETKKKQVRKAV